MAWEVQYIQLFSSFDRGARIFSIYFFVGNYVLPNLMGVLLKGQDVLQRCSIYNCFLLFGIDYQPSEREMREKSQKYCTVPTYTVAVQFLFLYRLIWKYQIHSAPKMERYRILYDTGYATAQVEEWYRLGNGTEIVKV